MASEEKTVGNRMNHSRITVTILLLLGLASWVAVAADDADDAAPRSRPKPDVVGEKLPLASLRWLIWPLLAGGHDRVHRFLVLDLFNHRLGVSDATLHR